MIKKVVAAFIVLIMLLTVASQAITVITETEYDKDVLIDIDTGEDNILADTEYIEIKKLVDESYDRVFEEFLQLVELYIDTQVNAMESTILEVVEEAMTTAESENTTSTASVSNNLVDAQLGAGGGSTNVKKQIAELTGETLKETIKEEKIPEIKQENDDNKVEMKEDLAVEMKEKYKDQIQKYGSKYIDQYSKIIINTAFEPVYDNIRDRINDSVPVLGSVVANVLKRYQNSLNLDGELSNEIKTALGIELKKEDPKKKEKEFDLGTEFVNAAFSALGTEGSKFAKKLVGEWGTSFLEKMGLDSSDARTIGGAAVNLLMVGVNSQINDTLNNMKNTVLGTSDKDEWFKEQVGMGFDEYREMCTMNMETDEYDEMVKKWDEHVAQKEKEARRKYDRATEAAQKALFNAVGDVAGKYAEELYDEIGKEIDEFAKDCGKFGGAIVKGLSNQLKSYIGTNIKQAVSSYLQNTFMGRDTATFKWDSFKPDWTQLGVSVLTSLISDQEVANMIDLAYGAVKGAGGLMSGPVPFEAYANAYYVFTIRTGTNVAPTLSSAAAAIAEATGKTNLAAGDSGSFGTGTIGGYAPDQFIPTGDSITLTSLGPVGGTVTPTPTAASVTIGALQIIPLEPTARTINCFVPSGWVPILPGVPLYADSGYIFCDMMMNKSKDSYVQRAFSASSLALAMGGGIPFPPTLFSALLNIEALEFLAFTTQSAAAGGYKHAIEDLTTHAVSRYHEEAGMFVVGPFKVDYIRSFSHTILRGKVEFGLMTEMHVYDQDGEEIPRGTWAIMYSEDGQFDHSTKWLDEGYAFPYPEEEFYIGISQSSNTNVRSVSRIELKYKEMQIAVYATLLSKQSFLVGYGPVNYIIGTVGPTHIPKWFNGSWMVPILEPVPYHSVCVTMATKYYVNHTQNIHLQKKDPTIPAWETAEYTTSSSVKTTGADFITLAAGLDKNSALYHSALSTIKNYQYVSPYSSTGSKFLDSAAKTYNIFASLDYNPTTVQALAIALETYGEKDWAKALLAGDAIFKNDESLYVKMIRIGAVLSENKDLQKGLDGLADIVAIFESPNDIDNPDRCISAMKVAAKSGTREHREIVNTIEDLYENSAYKQEVWDAACQMDMNDEQLDAYLAKRFPKLTPEERVQVIRESKAIRNIVENSGPAQEMIVAVMKVYQGAINGNIGVSDGILKLNSVMGDNEVIDSLGKGIERLTQTNERKKAIMEDPNLSDEDKAKLCREEDLKLWKMVAMTVEDIDTTGQFDKAEEYFKAYENYDQIKEYEKQIEAIEKDDKLSDTEKRDKLDRLYNDIAEAGINIGGSLEIINSKEFKNYKENYEDVQEQYNKIEDANKAINEIEKRTDITEEQKKVLIEEQKDKIANSSIKIADIVELADGSELKDYKEKLDATKEVDNALDESNRKIEAANAQIAKIEANTTLTQEQKNAQINAQKEIIEEQKNEQVDAVIGGLKKANKENKALYNKIEDIYEETSSLEPETTKRLFETLKNMDPKEGEQLLNSIEKADSTEDALKIINTYSTRQELKAASDAENGVEEPLRHIDSLEVDEGAQLFDDTRYTEYDTNYNITKVERPTDIWYMGDNEIDFTMSIGGVVWKDGHSGLETDYDGIRTANQNGDLEKGIEGVKVTLKRVDNGETGRMWLDGKWSPAITYTDEGGYYHMTEIESAKYYVEFEYDGQNYMATTYLSDGEKTGNQLEYLITPDLEHYDNNSKAAEDDAEREKFNDSFYEIVDSMALSKDFVKYNDTTSTSKELNYEYKNGVATLITLDDQGHVLPQFAMHASSAVVGVTYPIDSTVTFENEDTEMLVSAGGQTDVPAYYDYNRTGEYMYHVNLGLVERSKLELSTTSDVYTVTTTVNEKQEEYIYNERGILHIYDANLKQTDEYRNTAYTRELYNADYNLRAEDYQLNELNELDRNGNDNTAQIERIQAIKTEAIEQRVFVTYKITLANRSVLQSATINEITDYFDADYELVEEDIHQQIQDSHGVAHDKLVAKSSFFILEDKEGTTEYKLKWKSEGMVNGLQRYTTVRTINTPTLDEGYGLEDIAIGSGEEIYVFITFELKRDNDDRLERGELQNIVEISNYTALEIGSGKDHSIGLIDRDSEPDNLSVGIWSDYEDDTDAAPILNIDIYDTDMRAINGYVWNDERNKILSTGQKLGNGLRTDGEEKINGVRVQLVEKIRDPKTGKDLEYVWKEMYTGENTYKYVVNNNKYHKADPVTEANIVKTTDLGATRDGEYKFHDYVAGNFIVRFIYGDTYKTYLAKGSENNDGYEGKNEASYNGHDYKSTTYQQGNNLSSAWYDFDDITLSSRLYSDAKDDSTRRKVVNMYNTPEARENETQSFKNNRAEILASADGRTDKNYYNTELHDELRDSTWMFADTAKLNINVEYNTTESNGLKDLSYYIQNIDFGLEKRPETKLELTKEIVDIKVTLASGEVIINTAAGLSQNVNWVQNQRNAVQGYDYKRDNLKYTYRQGKIHVYMDEEIMQGTNVQVTYKITVKNNSEIDYTGQNGEPGYVYYTGEVYPQDRIVTTRVDKIIDYVDNSLTFRKADNPSSTKDTEGWKLIENTREFTTTDTGLQVETEQMTYSEFQVYVQKNYNIKDSRVIAAAWEKYRDTGDLTGLGQVSNFNTNESGIYLKNDKIIQNMKNKGYLNNNLSIVKTKTGQLKENPITQVIVTDELENTELKPGQSASVLLVLTKTLSPQDDDSTLDYSNMAEILEYTNKIGRRDMDAIPGNQQPNADPDSSEFEYDTDFTERIIITPPTGENRAFYYVITTLVLAILTLGIVLIKKLVLGKK